MNLNIGHQCTRAQCDAGLSEKVALRWLQPSLERRDYTFGDLERRSNQAANALAALGLVPGDVLFTFLPRMPDQFFAFLGALKLRLLTGTLFANFGEDALLDRLGDSGARAIVTKKSFLKKLLRIRGSLPALQFILLVDDENADGTEGIYHLPALTAAAPDQFAATNTPADTPSVLHYTSGSTGKPKGVVHVHGSLAHQRATTRDVLGLGSDDVYWCTADQGWVTGTSYGIIGPWSMGVTQVHFGGAYEATKWMQLLERQRVTVWYSAPTALRMLMREDEEALARHDLSSLRSVFSVGEPLNPEVIRWGRRVLQRDIHDTWFQTETGGIMITNRPGLPIRPGSMGKPVDGVRAAILDEAGRPAPIGAQGHLCLVPGWPSMFVTYLGNTAVYGSKFKHGHYHTGDTARVDDEGYYWFLGRADDVINTGGHLISPFEIESALLELPEVAEAAAIAVPDDLLFEAVVVYVTCHAGVTWSKELELKVRLQLANKLSTIATPRSVIECSSIPKNKSGKIMRRVLKARYLGEPEGDLSTLED